MPRKHVATLTSHARKTAAKTMMMIRHYTQTGEKRREQLKSNTNLAVIALRM
jgi:hypothetical protein